MFIPGATVTQKFTIPFEDSDIAKVVVTYKQNDRMVLAKTITSFEHITETSSRLTVSLSQQESLLFDCGSEYEVQLNVMTLEGARAPSKPIVGYTGIQQFKKVISNE